MRKIGSFLLLGLLLLTGFSAEGLALDEGEPVDGYRQIDQESAKERMEQDDGHVVLDVRRFDEYESGHIPGALCIPNEDIENEPPEELPNPEQIILIYCRSGNRSKQAARKLAEMGYTNLYEFGGIIDWTGEIAEGQSLALTLESNPTTGYSWTAAQEGELFEIQSYYTAQPQSVPMSGSGGWQRFILTPKQAGTAELSFRYSRPWEPSEADPSFRCTLAISEDLQITVTEDSFAEAAESGYAPTVKIY